MIVDANVALKWFVVEPDSAAARELLSHGGVLWAPEVIFAELANIAWLKVRQGELERAAAAGLFTELRRLIDIFIPSAELAPRALEISIELDHPAYNCFYLALAEREKLALVTADKRLIRKIAATPFARLARPLADT